MSTLNFQRRRPRDMRLAGTYCATFMRLAGTYYNAFDEAGTRQGISSALNCIQNFFLRITTRRVTPFFYPFLIGRRYFATDFEWEALKFILSNVFSICVQNFSWITVSTLIILKIQL